MWYFIGLVAAVLLGAGFVLQQDAAQRVPQSDFLRARLIADLLRQPRWLAGLGIMIAGQLLGAWSSGTWCSRSPSRCWPPTCSSP